MANPYARFLSGGDVMEQVASGPGLLAAALMGRDMDSPLAPGKWSARQVLAHLADTEIAFGFRLRQAVAETGHVIQPFDQDKWATGYASADAETALALFGLLRKWNVQFLRALPEGTLEKGVVHPERGTMTVRTIVETMAGHDGNHLAQLQSGQ